MVKTWRQKLDKLYFRMSGEDKEREATESMQQSHPGPYVVEEFYNPKVMRFDFKLKFEDKKQELMWLIKNSSE